VAASALGALLAPSALAISGTDPIRAFAGTGIDGFAGDGGPATSAELRNPVGITAAADGRVMIPDSDDHRLRVVGPDGIIRTLAGTGVDGLSGDGGQAAAAQLSSPVDSAVDAVGNVLIADRTSHRIRRIAPNGVITTFAGSGTGGGFAGDGGAATSARLNNPSGVTVDAAGNVYIADQLNSRIRRVAPDGTISTVAGTGTAGSTGDGGAATAAQLNRPIDVRIDGAGSIFIADVAAHRIRRITPDGIITTVAGTGTGGYSGDGGAATSAQLNGPVEVVPDAFGNLYIADSENHRVRRVNAGGAIETIAGTGTVGFTGDGGPARLALLNTPAGVALTAGGDLLVADRNNNRVRVIDGVEPAGVIPSGTAVCRPVTDRPPPSRGGGGRVTLTPKQLLINQRISQAAVRRVNAVQRWLDDGLVTDDLCGGAFIGLSFGPGITVGATSAARPEALGLPNPRPVVTTGRGSGNAAGVRLEAKQLLISQRISQAAVRRANALAARLEGGLTGGDLRAGAVTPAKIAVGVAITAASAAPTPAPSRTVVARPPSGPPARVELSARQILINQRIAQAAVRRSNALVDRLGGGFSARDFQPGTVTLAALAPSARP